MKRSLTIIVVAALCHGLLGCDMVDTLQKESEKIGSELGKGVDNGLGKKIQHYRYSASYDRRVNEMIRAVTLDRTGEVKRLLSDGCNINGQGDDGETPLMRAVFDGNKMMAELLIEKGANVNIHGKDGITALMGAATAGSTKMVEFLIDKGADVNFRGSKGLTALMVAAAQGHIDVVKVLFVKGADIRSEGDGGITALSLALRNERHAVAELLKQGEQARTGLIDVDKCCKICDKMLDYLNKRKKVYSDMFSRRISVEDLHVRLSALERDFSQTQHILGQDVRSQIEEFQKLLDLGYRGLPQPGDPDPLDQAVQQARQSYVDCIAKCKSNKLK
jgi:uncharacterized protein